MSRSRPCRRASRSLRTTVDLDGRRLVHAQQSGTMSKLRLLDAAVLQRDLAIEGRGDAENDAALDLRLHRVGIDDRCRNPLRRRPRWTRTVPSAERPRPRPPVPGSCRTRTAARRRGRALRAAAAPSRPCPQRDPAPPSRAADLLSSMPAIGDRHPASPPHASSSMKLSVTNTLCEGPTLRQNAVGMPGGSTRTYSTWKFGRS